MRPWPRPVRYVCLVASGWVVLLLATAAWVFLESRAPGFHSGVGPLGFFLFAAYLLSIYYLIGTVVVSIVVWCVRDSLRWRRDHRER